MSTLLKKEITALPIEWLQRGRYQPRKNFDKEKLAKLAASIKQDGIISPITVRPIDKSKYEIIAGERRWRAAQLVGYTEVPCFITSHTNEEAMRIALVENLARDNLNPIEEAKAIEHYADDFGYTHEEVGKFIGKSRSEVTNLLRLLNLDTRVQELIIKGDLTESHGKILASLPLNEQFNFAKEAHFKQWSTRLLEAAVKKAQKENNKPVATSQSVDIARLERKLSEQIGFPTKINLENSQKGNLHISFADLDGLESILEKLGYIAE